MSRIFRAHHAYHPYDPYIHEKLNQMSHYCLPITNCSESKDGKARKDHVIETFWNKSKSTIFHYLVRLMSSEGGHVSL
jgi:hypothetical protein